jgi:toxin FitB
MNLLDSSAWLAFFADEDNADRFSKTLDDPAELIVPTVVIYEVFMVLLRETGEEDALKAYAAMGQGQIVDITSPVAVDGARLSLHYQLPMADSMILAIAYATDAVLWTQDADFIDIPGVKYFPIGN